MHHGKRPVLALSKPSQVQDATHVDCSENIGFGFQDMIEFQVAHPLGDIGKRDRKGAPKSTALLTFAKRDQFQTFNGFQQPDRGWAAVRSPGVTGPMKGHPFRIGARPRFDTETVENEINQPNGYFLAQNYPNPFNPSTNIKFGLREAGFVSLKIYDVLGNEVAALVNEYKSAGNYEISFYSAQLSSGTYIYRLLTNNFSETRKMILEK